MATLFLIFAIVFLVSCIPLAVVVIHSYRRFRGPRVVLCPETITPEAVEVGAVRAAWSVAAGDQQFRLTSCSRWPERRECAQRCLTQIESAPDGCLVRNRVARWYEGSRCALCGNAIGEVRRIGRGPGLVGPDGTIHKWRDLTVEDLAEAFATHRPICSNCCAKAKQPPSTRSSSAA
jgi:hypothetical protein